MLFMAFYFSGYPFSWLFVSTSGFFNCFTSFIQNFKMIIKSYLRRPFKTILILLTCLQHPFGPCFCWFCLFFYLSHQLFLLFYPISKDCMMKKQKKLWMKILEIYSLDNPTFGSQDFIHEFTARKIYTILLHGLILIAILTLFGLIFLYFYCLFDFLSWSVLIDLLVQPYFCLV